MLRICLFSILLFSFLFSDDIAIVKNTKGDVFAKRAESMHRLLVGDKLQERDILITKSLSSIGVLFNDGASLALGENSILSVNRYIFKPTKNQFQFDMNMRKGLATFESGKIGKLSPESVKFRVPEGIIGIRGTKFFVEVK